MNIDWSKAPEGATHFNEENSIIAECWIKHSGGECFYAYNDNRSWIHWPAGDQYTHLFKARPAPEWIGTGLPPVGTVCEVLWNESRMEYLRTKVFGVNEHGQPIHRFDEGPKKFEYQADPLVTVLGTKVFRPIRTPEQIEAEEREKAVKVMLDLDPPHESGFGLTSRKTFCETLYDAGYRKQPKEGA